MTWEGGKDYVIDQGWTEQIDVAKIKHISNGVIIDSFDRNSVENQITDSDLDNKEYKNIVYAGSIRKVNNLGMLLDSAKIIQNQGIEDIRFLIYVAGNECKSLKNRCKEENITNVIFKGCVEKKADVIGFDLNEKKIELYKSGVDPQADAADAKHEYGVDLVDLSEVRDADCLVFAVAHNEFRNLSWEQIDGLFGKCPANEKILIDVKSILDKSEIEELGYSYWRL